ncbi:MAG TPA: RluA family pseudouridine synthase [Tepidisphaeraceae bacterium]|nr:RluA family pseudouridine synthase [Tepidisphaeraceae bacterium]
MTDRADPSTLLSRLQREFPKAKKQTLKEMVQQRRVLVNDRPAGKLSQPVGVRDAVRVLSRGAVAPPPRAPSLHPLKLVHEDDDLLVIDKPAGLLTSTVPSEKRPTALAIVRRYVEAKHPRAPRTQVRVGLIHRLDKEASGLLVFSKSPEAYESLKTQFFRHTVERVYQATVEGTPKPAVGRMNTRLVEHADGTVHSTKAEEKGQRAITEYEVIRSADGRSDVRVRLQTGRKHQIRVHFSERGWPIVGDTVYGKKRSRKLPPVKLMLRAVRLSLEHPRTGERMTFDAAVS